MPSEIYPSLIPQFCGSPITVIVIVELPDLSDDTKHFSRSLPAKQTSWMLIYKHQNEVDMAFLSHEQLHQSFIIYILRLERNPVEKLS